MPACALKVLSAGNAAEGTDKDSVPRDLAWWKEDRDQNGDLLKVKMLANRTGHVSDEL